MQLPIVPAFVAGDTSMVKMQQLSGCVSFLTSANNFPIWHVYRTATAAVTTGFSLITFPYTAIDSDRVSSGGSTITIQTPGYYATEACVPVQTRATAFDVRAVFLWTAGPFNAHYTAGATKIYGLRSGHAINSAGMDEVMCLDDLCPVVCYPGDTIGVEVVSTIASTLDANAAVGSCQGRFVCNFTGKWVRTGS